ncbi:MAG: ferritin-like domain-containing protein [Burkholderiales bacterium]
MQRVSTKEAAEMMFGIPERRFPLRMKPEIPGVTRWWTKSKASNWDPVTAIPWDQCDPNRYTEEQRLAGRLFWSRRAWQEYTGISESPIVLLRMTLEGMADTDAKFVLAAKTMDEAKHCESCYMMAERLGGYIDEPDPLVFGGQMVAGMRAKALDPNLSLDALIAGWHCVFEGCAFAMLAAKHKRATDPAAKEILRLICQDEVRHVQFGWDYLDHRVPQLKAEEIKAIQRFVIEVIVDVELTGFHSSTPVADAPETKSVDAICAEAGLGGCPPGEEHEALRKCMGEIRERMTPWGVHVPKFAELGET